MKKVLNDTKETKEYLNSLPKVYIAACWAGWGVAGFPFSGKYYRTFESISIRTVYKEISLTLQEIMQKFDADLVIQYLKERGLTACPLVTGG